MMLFQQNESYLEEKVCKAKQFIDFIDAFIPWSCNTMLHNIEQSWIQTNAEMVGLN